MMDVSPTSMPPVSVRDEHGTWQQVSLSCELPLTLFVNDQKVVTLMTLRQYPDALAIGYLRNQGLLSRPDDIADLIVNDDEVRITTSVPITVNTGTTGCAMGCTTHSAQPAFPDDGTTLTASALTAILAEAQQHEATYKASGTVHSCGLASNAKTKSQMLLFVEDVGRHNAVDTVAGLMWQRSLSGHDKVFYATGRLTAEIVIKAARMGIPYLVSRSMLTQLGFDLAQRLNMTVVARARQSRYWVFGKHSRFSYE